MPIKMDLSSTSAESKLTPFTVKSMKDYRNWRTVVSPGWKFSMTLPMVALLLEMMPFSN
jgi:hypothetical protein